LFSAYKRYFSNRLTVIPAKAGIQRLSATKSLDPSLTSFAVVKRLAGMTSKKIPTHRANRCY
jgi:hypothetical protein